MAGPDDRQRPRSVVRDLGLALGLLLVLTGGIVLPYLGLVVLRSTGSAASKNGVPESEIVQKSNQPAAAGFRGLSDQQLYVAHCASCHGLQGQGQPRTGSTLAASRFVSRTDDDALLRFLQQGREPNDPQSVMNGYMPPRGGNPNLSDATLRAIIRHLRLLNPRIDGEGAEGDQRQ